MKKREFFSLLLIINIIKMKKTISIIVVLSLFTACSTDKSQKGQVTDIPQVEQLQINKVELAHKDTIAAETSAKKIVKPQQSVEKAPFATNKQINITYKGKDRNRIVKATDIFKNIHYVPLETNEAALLNANPYCIVCRNNYIYILDSKYSGNEIHLYDSKGKYIRDIGRKGEGPEDYLGGLHIAVNSKGMLSLPDRMRSEIINYTQEGEFVSRIKMDTVSMSKNIFLNDSLLLLESFYDRPGHKFHIVNVFNKKVVRTFYPIKNRIYMIGFPETMTKYGDKILISECQSNDILEVTLDGVKVRYIININDKMPPKGFWDQKASSYSLIADENRRMGYIGHIPCFTETDHSIFFGFRGLVPATETQGWALIDKVSGKSQTFKKIELAENVCINPQIFHFVEEGKIVMTVSPETILNSGNQEFISQFPELKEDDNPILMFAELK